MDSENRIIIKEKLKNLVPTLSEDLFISISNKGIVNRGKKDLEKERDHIVFTINEKGELIAAAAEETFVTLKDAVTACTCSCPSLSVCRHIIMVLYYAKEYYESMSNGTAVPRLISYENEEILTFAEINYTSTKEDYIELNTLTIDEIKKIIGKKDYMSIINSIDMSNDTAVSQLLKNEAVFSYGEMLQVSLKSQDVTVYFPKTSSIANSICSCKERGMCRHKSYALISYLVTECNISLPYETETIELKEKEIMFLRQVKVQMESYLEKGIASLTKDIIWQTEQNYIRAYALKLFQLAVEFKLLSSNFAAYFSKNLSYSNAKTMHIICKIYNRTMALLNMSCDDSRKGLLIGKRKEESFKLNELLLIGLGVVPKLTKRNDLLFSAYFYCMDLKEILILSTLRPLENQKDMLSLKEYLFKTGLFWSDELPLNKFYKNQITVKDAVITSGRISGTKSSVCTIKEQVTEKCLFDICLKDFGSLREELRGHTYQYFAPYTEVNRIYLVQIYDMGITSYDKIKQRLLFPIYDKTGEEIMIEIQYNAITEKVIGALENNRDIKFSYLLGDFREKNGKITGMYLSGMYNGTICNLYF